MSKGEKSTMNWLLRVSVVIVTGVLKVKGMAKLRNTQVMKKLETTSNISCEM
jgi:hypothetical protein